MSNTKHLTELNAVLEKLVKTQQKLIEAQQNEIGGLNNVIEVLCADDEDLDGVTIH